VKALFVGAPDGLTETHKNVFEPRVGLSYGLNEKTIVKVSSGVFHNRVTLNDSLLLGGNPPFQPQVGATNGSVDNPGGRRRRLAAVRHDRDRPGVQAPRRLHVFDRRPARSAARLRHRRDLCWTVGPQPAARARHQPAAGRHATGEPGGQYRLPAPVQGLRRHPPVGERRPLDLQRPAAERGPPLQERLQVRPAYTLSHSLDNASTKRDILFNSYDDSGFWGNSSFDRRHVFNFYYIYDLPFFQQDKSR
jgi:hypothetical protein